MKEYTTEEAQLARAFDACDERNGNREQIELPLRFRWPIVKVSDNEIHVHVPLSPMGGCLVQIDQDAAKQLRLSPSEYEAARKAAELAVIKAIMIIQ